MKKFIYYTFLIGIICCLFILTNCAENDGIFKDSSTLPDLTVTTTANYSITFETNWNATNFPTDFPLTPFFSKTILSTHNNLATIFIPETIASAELNDFAINGNSTLLETLLTAQQTAENAVWFDLGTKLTSGINTLDNFTISSKHPQFSICMKIQPSPNWFLGVNSISLLQNDGEWTPTATINLIAYDTDGFTQPTTTYNSAYVPVINGLISPINPTALNPAIMGIPLGRIVLTKLP